MPFGLLFGTGADGRLNANDAASTIGNFTMAQTLGRGRVSFTSGSGSGFRDGVYMLGTDGTLRFVPDVAFPTNITGAAVTTAPNVGVITGTGGNDAAINGTAGSDVIYGGTTSSETATGDDTINAGDGNDYVYAGSGNDTIFGGAGNDSIFGGDSADRIDGGTGDDSIDGGAGDDSIDGGAGNDRLFGGAGNDTVSGGADNDYIDGGDGNDSLRGDAGIDTLLGGVGDDTLDGGIGDDRLYGGSGADSIQGGDGNDIIVGGTANGTITNGGFNGNANGWTGTDIEYNSEATYLTNGATNGVVEMDGSAGQTTVMQQNITVTEPGMTTLGFRAGMRPGASGTTSGKTGIDGFRVDVLDAQGNVLFTQTVLPQTVAPAWTTYSFDVGLPASGTYTLRFTEIGDNDSYGALLDDITLTNGVDGADMLAGGAGDDTIHGQTGADSLSGDAGNDVLFGGADNDTLSGGAGNDQLLGGTGSDLFVVTDSDGTNTVTGGEDAGNTETDTLSLGGATGVNVTYSGNEAGTATYGATGGQTTFDQIERVVTTAQADTIDGRLATGGIDVDAGAGNDSITGGSGSDTILGGAGDDSIAGGTGDDMLFGGAGADRIEGGAGNDTIDGGGADGAADVLVLRNGFGRDTVTSGDAPVAIGGGRYSSLDTLDVTNLFDAQGNRVNTRDVVVSTDANGNAVLTFPSGDALVVVGLSPALAADEFFLNAIGIPLPDGTVSGTAGNDTIGAGYVDGDGDRRDGNDAVLTGAAGDDDLIRAEGGNDTVFAGLGNDQVFGGDGADILYGEAGNDTLLGEAGTDTLFGGAGNDTASGGDGADVLFGEDGNDSLSGDAGADTLFGGAGNDTIAGGADNDVVRGGTGADSLDGGTGIDTLDYADSAAGVTVNLATNTATGGDATGDTIANFENVTGSASADTITLSNTAGTVVAGAGNDTVTGGTGNDSLSGDAGADTLFGGAGNDTIAGGIGSDTLFGGAGNDTLIGGTGTDTLVGGTGSDTLDAGASDGAVDVVVMRSGDGNDIVTGFEAPIADGNGGFVGRDQIDAEAMLDGQGNRVNVRDVVVGNDGSGNAVLTFPGGESLTVVGVTPAQAANPFFLNAMGIPLPDGTVTGTAGADVIEGGYTDADGDRVDAGDAILPGMTGDDDVIAAGGGDDIVRAGAGRDTVFGGTGNDSLDGGAGDDTLYGEAGSDILSGGAGIDSLFGGDGADTLSGGTGNDSLSGGDGDDTFVVGPGDGNDTIIGGEAGQTTGDTLDARTITADTTLTLTGPEQGTLTAGLGDGNATNDTAVSFSEIERFFLGSGRDTVLGGEGDDTVDMGAGDDVFRLFDRFGDDSVTGGNGGEVTGDTLDGSAVTDDLTVTLSAPGAGTLTDGSDTVTFTQIEGVVTGSGDDRVTGSTGSDRIATGAGADTIDGGAGDDTIDGGAGNDSIIGGAGNDSILAGAGADRIEGGAGDDRIDLGAADGMTDTVVLRDGSGDDVVFAFAGPVANPDGSFTPQDLLDVSDLRDAQGQPVNVADVTVTDDGNGNAMLGFPNGESIVLNGIDPVAAADPAFLAALGIPPTDGTVSGTAGDDLIAGGYVDADGDRVDGGDAAAPGAGPDDDVIDAGDGNDTVRTGAGSDSVAGGAGNDSLSGGDGDDTLSGDAGDDTLSGEAGDDVLTGGDGNDVLDGGEGRDTLFGGAGADRLTLGLGDTADGGAENDDFILPDSTTGPAGRIVVAGGDGFDRLIIDRSQIASGLPDFRANPSASGTLTLLNGTTVDYTSIEGIICFTPGTRIATPMGARDIATLRVGDLVMTRDHGLQPIRWIQQRTVRAAGRFAPIRIRPGVLTGQDSDLLVSPQHRMLFQGYRAELLFGETEVLVAARHLVDGAQVTREAGGQVTYIHMMFDAHEIVFAEGAATESFHPGAVGLDAIHDAAREELFAVFPELRADLQHYGDTARRCLRRHEAELLRV
ncbi:Hemolysin-type calcium-binding repeat-containing protein [Loktanella fryxellensis]|uniref:Hemolysin-type calcium-binding repeat-containing protein n=1 Tax=Loktanella fryxellensis TaxID=245187 RepID=A0A1H7Z4G9_9RHOB|nr:Hint domain-containing protein [Loktanella fryxellensis]SEM52367.1 Hemolysin-type calcium-binding repeat-containing protein [Loktanella fryxellensis]